MSKIADQQYVGKPHTLKYTRRPFVAGPYIQKESFHAFEVSTELAETLADVPWLTVTTEDDDHLKEIINHGYEFEGTLYKSFFALWKDRNGKAILVPQDSDVTMLSLGYITHMEVPDDSMKAAKYINRHFAPLKKGEKYIKFDYVEGGPEDADANGNFEAIFRSPKGHNIFVSFQNLKTQSPGNKGLGDGHLDCSQEFVDIMAEHGVKVKHAQSWTIPTQFGMGKGHSRIIPGLEPHLVIHGAKTIYTIKDGMKFGIRADMHPGQPNTDIFAIFNFQFDELLRAHTKKFLKWVWKNMHDEILCLRMFLGNINTKSVGDRSEDWGDWDQDEVVEVESDWPLPKYLRAGASPFAFPWMYRKIYQHVARQMVQVGRGRIPLEYGNGLGVAISRYVAGDIYSVMPNGMINEDNCIIPEGFCCCMDLAEGAKVVIYRQPNENQNAHYILTNMHHPAYQFAKGGSYIYIGKGIEKIAPELGGMDMDDSLIIITDPEWVRWFEHLELTPYPRTGPLVPVEKSMFDEGFQEFYGELMDESPFEGAHTPQYTNAHALHQIKRATSAGAGIGPVANAVLNDIAISIPRYKSFIAGYLQERNMLDMIDWLATKPDYKLAVLGNHMELVIDGNVKDRALLAALGDVNAMLKDFTTNNRMYAQCLTQATGKSQGGKVPASKLDKDDWIAVPTPVCALLADIRSQIAMLEEAFKTNEWLVARPADRDVLKAYPSNPEVVTLVHGQKPKKDELMEDMEPGLLTIWRRGFRDAFASGMMDDPDYALKVRKDSVQDVLDFVAPYQHLMPEIAVELYRTYYKSRQSGPSMDESTGKRRTYPDGLFGVPEFANALLWVFQDLGFTGATFKVDFDKWTTRVTQIRTEVTVIKGNVYRISDNRLLGFCKRAPDTDKCLMIGGMLITKFPHDCLVSERSELVEDMDIAAQI